MRKNIAALLVLAPSLAFGQGVSRARPPDEAMLFSRHMNTLASANPLQATALPLRGFTVARVTTYVTVVSGGGAGSTTFRVSDGTNNCDCAMTCATSQSTGPKGLACTGTCSFAPSASLTLSISATTCTTTQPTIMTIDVRGYWR